MASEMKVSAEALGIATLEVAHRIIQHLVDRQIMTEDEECELFSKAADGQRSVDRPGNQEAAELLAGIAKAGRTMATSTFGCDGSELKA